MCVRENIHRNGLNSSKNSTVKYGLVFDEFAPRLVGKHQNHAGARPTVTVRKDKTPEFEGETIVITSFGLGHTGSDLTVYFTKADVVSLGDIWWNGYYPFIDYSIGGSIDGAIRLANASLALVTDQTIIIPGDGPVG